MLLQALGAYIISTTPMRFKTYESKALKYSRQLLFLLWVGRTHMESLGRTKNQLVSNSDSAAQHAIFQKWTHSTI